MKEEFLDCERCFDPEIKRQVFDAKRERLVRAGWVKSSDRFLRPTNQPTARVRGRDARC